MRISDWSSDVCSSDLGAAYALVWLGVLAIFRISSLAGMSAVTAAAAAALLLGYPQFFPALAAIALLILWLHRENIGRLMRGEAIGRASCRERVCQSVYISVVGVTLKKKQTQSK